MFPPLHLSLLGVNTRNRSEMAELLSTWAAEALCGAGNDVFQEDLMFFTYCITNVVALFFTLLSDQCGLEFFPHYGYFEYVLHKYERNLKKIKSGIPLR